MPRTDAGEPRPQGGLYHAQTTHYIVGSNQSPPGSIVPYHATLFSVNDSVPMEAELEAEVKQLRLNKAGRHTHLCTDHFNKCLRELYLSDGTSAPPQFGSVAEAGRTETVHVISQVYTDRDLMGYLILHSQCQHQHPVYRPGGYTVEGGRGNH